VVAVTLGLTVGCGGNYGVGSGEGGESSGGSNASGQGGNGTGGTNGGKNGGKGGLTSGGVAGDSNGGASAGTGAGGGSAATGGAQGCRLSTDPLPEYTPASPAVVWGRLSLFFYGAMGEPLEPLPDTATTAWVRGRVRAILEREWAEFQRAPAGLQEFMQDWAFDGNANSARAWSSAFANPEGNFAHLLTPFSFLTDQAFLVAHPTPSRRGNWIAWNLACNGPQSPPPEFEAEPVTVPPNMTRRQAVEAATSDDVCAGCHFMMDPLGFSLEHYDELGNYRTTENGLPIDSTGGYSFETFSAYFSDIDDLSTTLFYACDSQHCFGSRLLEYALTRVRPGDVSFEGSETAYIFREFTQNSLAFGPLLEAVATTPAFLRE
jgi:hypothetical protein